VYSFAGFCSISILLVFLLGILIVKVPWLGIFAIVSLVPGISIMWLIYWNDHQDKAYLSRVVKFIIFGMLGVFPVAFVELFFEFFFGQMETAMSRSVPTLFEIFFASFTNAFLVAALCEEVFKYIIAISVSVKPGRDTPYSVLVYSAAGAIGLATLENMMYILLTGVKGSLILTLFTAITRAIMAVPLHATTGVLIGVDVGQRKFNQSTRNILQTLAIPFLLHGTYDFCTMFTSFYYAAYDHVPVGLMFLPLISFVVVIMGAIYARKRRRMVLAADHTMYHMLPYNLMNNV